MGDSRRNTFGRRFKTDELSKTPLMKSKHDQSVQTAIMISFWKRRSQPLRSYVGDTGNRRIIGSPLTTVACIVCSELPWHTGQGASLPRLTFSTRIMVTLGENAIHQ